MLQMTAERGLLGGQVNWKTNHSLCCQHCPVERELGTHYALSHQYWTSLLYDRAGSRDSVFTKRRGRCLRGGRRREGGREGEKERWRSGSIHVVLFSVGDRFRTNRGGYQWPGF